MSATAQHDSPVADVPARSWRRRPWTFGWIAAGISGLLALLACEALLRWRPLVEQDRMRHDPLVGHRLIENFNGWFVNPGDGGRRRVVVNSQGLLDREYSLHKPAHAARILLLGDSYCEAAQVDFDESFHALLEEQLNRRSAPRPVEIINGGVAGYGTDNMLLFYRHVGREFHPDLVLMTFVTNDLENNHRALQLRGGEADQEPYFTLDDERLVLHDHPCERPGDGFRQSLHRLSRTYHHAWRMWYTLKRQQRAEKANLKLPYQFSIHLADEDDEHRRAWRLTEALYRTVRDETAADGAKLAVMIVTCSQQVHPLHRASFEQRYPQMAKHEWDWDKPNRRVREICEKLEIPCLDLLPPFRAAAAKDETELHHLGGHWTAAGHALAARELQRFLNEQFPDLVDSAEPPHGSTPAASVN